MSFHRIAKPLAILLSCKQTDCITAGISKRVDPMLVPTPSEHSVNTKHLYDFIQCWSSVEDVGPTLYEGYTNVLCLLGRRTFSLTLYISPMLVQCWASIADVGLTLKQR